MNYNHYSNVNNTWFKTLLNNDNSLLNNKHLMLPFVIIRNELKGYKIFNNLQDLNRLSLKQSNHNHEVILDKQPNRLRFDLDCNLNDFRNLVKSYRFILDDKKFQNFNYLIKFLFDKKNKKKLINSVSIINDLKLLIAFIEQLIIKYISSTIEIKLQSITDQDYNVGNIDLNIDDNSEYYQMLIDSDELRVMNLCPQIYYSHGFWLDEGVNREEAGDEGKNKLNEINKLKSFNNEKINDISLDSVKDLNDINIY